MTVGREGPRDSGRGGPRLVRLLLLVVVLAVAGVLLLAGAALTLARVTTPEPGWGLALTALSPWGLPAFAVALAGFLVALRLGGGRPVRLPALLALAGLVTQAVWLGPAFVGDHADGPADLTVLQLNVRFGTADPGATAGLARRTGADVVALDELTPEALDALRDQGLTRRLPHHAGAAVEGEGGVEVFSRYRLTDVRRLDVRTGGWLVRVHAPTPFWLVAVHADQPFVVPALWRHDLAVVGDVVGHLSGPRLVVGDLNATVDHAPLRRLLGAGLDDAAREANAGWQPTWPGADGPRGLRSVGLVAIDHVLLGGGVGAVSTDTAVVPGTDHRALVARLVLPGRGPGAAAAATPGGIPLDPR